MACSRHGSYHASICPSVGMFPRNPGVVGGVPTDTRWASASRAVQYRSTFKWWSYTQKAVANALWMQCTNNHLGSRGDGGSDASKREEGGSSWGNLDRDIASMAIYKSMVDCWVVFTSCAGGAEFSLVAAQHAKKRVDPPFCFVCGPLSSRGLRFARVPVLSSFFSLHLKMKTPKIITRHGVSAPGWRYFAVSQDIGNLIRYVLVKCMFTSQNSTSKF